MVHGTFFLPLHSLNNRVSWPSGQAEVCKTSYSGSTPLDTSGKKAAPVEVQPFLFLFRIKQVFANQDQEECENAAHDHPQEGCKKLGEPECLQEKQDKMMYQDQA